jgi:hypothetical protein
LLSALSSACAPIGDAIEGDPHFIARGITARLTTNCSLARTRVISCWSGLIPRKPVGLAEAGSAPNRDAVATIEQPLGVSEPKSPVRPIGFCDRISIVAVRPRHKGLIGRDMIERNTYWHGALPGYMTFNSRYGGAYGELTLEFPGVALGTHRPLGNCHRGSGRDGRFWLS